MAVDKTIEKAIYLSEYLGKIPGVNSTLLNELNEHISMLTLKRKRYSKHDLKKLEDSKQWALPQLIDHGPDNKRIFFVTENENQSAWEKYIKVIPDQIEKYKDHPTIVQDLKDIEKLQWMVNTHRDVAIALCRLRLDLDVVELIQYDADKDDK